MTFHNCCLVFCSQIYNLKSIPLHLSCQYKNKNNPSTLDEPDENLYSATVHAMLYAMSSSFYYISSTKPQIKQTTPYTLQTRSKQPLFGYCASYAACYEQFLLLSAQSNLRSNKQPPALYKPDLNLLLFCYYACYEQFLLFSQLNRTLDQTNNPLYFTNQIKTCFYFATVHAMLHANISPLNFIVNTILYYYCVYSEI